MHMLQRKYNIFLVSGKIENIIYKHMLHMSMVFDDYKYI